MKNKVELLLAMTEYDNSYQPLANEGIYISGSTDFILYGAGRVSEKKLINIVKDMYIGKISIQEDHVDDMIFGKQFEYFHNYTIYKRDFIDFKFVFVPKGKEELLVPILKEYDTDKDAGLKVLSFACYEDGTVKSSNETKALILIDDKNRHIEELIEIATWKKKPVNFENIFNDFAMSSFASEYFGNPKDAKEVDKTFRELSKIHHPDKGGDELMFKALSTARRFLKGKIKQQDTKKIEG